MGVMKSVSEGTLTLLHEGHYYPGPFAEMTRRSYQVWLSWGKDTINEMSINRTGSTTFISGLLNIASAHDEENVKRKSLKPSRLIRQPVGQARGRP